MALLSYLLSVSGNTNRFAQAVAQMLMLQLQDSLIFSTFLPMGRQSRSEQMNSSLVAMDSDLPPVSTESVSLVRHRKTGASIDTFPPPLKGVNTSEAPRRKSTKPRENHDCSSEMIQFKTQWKVSEMILDSMVEHQFFFWFISLNKDVRCHINYLH